MADVPSNESQCGQAWLKITWGLHFMSGKVKLQKDIMSWPQTWLKCKCFVTVFYTYKQSHLMDYQKWLSKRGNQTIVTYSAFLSKSTETHNQIYYLHYCDVSHINYIVCKGPPKAI